MTVNSKVSGGRYVALQVVKWILFALLLAVCFLVQTAGSTVKPLLLIPAALCIAAHTGEIPAMAVGVISGLLLDLACGKLLGYNAIWLVVCCVTVSLLHSYLLQEKLVNMILLCAVCTAVQGSLDYVFYYAIWGYEDVSLVYRHVMLPSGIMTMVALLPIYLLVRSIARRCASRRTHELEKTIVRDP